METTIKTITNEEYNKIKNEIKKRYPFVSVSRNNQDYAFGGFNVRPRDYDNGLTNEQIDKLCIFLKSSGYDTEEFSIEQGEQRYDKEQDMEETKMKYVFFNGGFGFLMNITKN